MRVIVMGGSGLIGRKLVSRLHELGHNAVAASPSTGVNSVTGVGLSDALVGADTVVDVTNSPSFEDTAVREFFENSTRNLLAAEAKAGVGHHVALSIVGADRIPDSGYMRAKVTQEQLIRSAEIPYTIFRATQFFEFIEGVIAQFPSDGQSLRVPTTFFQPVLTDDVVAALADVTLAAPSYDTIDLAGPERFRFDDVVRQFLAARKDSRQLVADTEARYFGAKLNDESLVPDGGSLVGTTRFQDWLSSVGKTTT